MRLDRVQGQDEVRRDLFVRAILGESLQDFNLARAQRHYQSCTILPVIMGPPLINDPTINEAALLGYRLQKG